MRPSAAISLLVASSRVGFFMSKSKLPKVHINPFEPRPKILKVGDTDPREILVAVGNALGSWEMAEVSFAHLFNALVRPQINSPALRRAYGSIISSKVRREMIEASADVFFHQFPNTVLESEFGEFANIYSSAVSRRNDFAHGVVFAGLAPRKGWYLEANTYGSKRDVRRNSQYAYTSHQINAISKNFSNLASHAYAFGDTLKEHFASSDPKLRARY